MMATPYLQARLRAGLPTDPNNLHTMSASGLPRFPSFPGTLYAEQTDVPMSQHTMHNSSLYFSHTEMERLAELDPSTVSMILAEAEKGAIIRPQSPFYNNGSAGLHPKSASQAAAVRGPHRRASLASEIPSRYPRSNIGNYAFQHPNMPAPFPMPQRTPSLAMLTDMAELSLTAKGNSLAQTGESYEFNTHIDNSPLNPVPFSTDLDVPKSGFDLGFLLSNAIAPEASSGGSTEGGLGHDSESRRSSQTGTSYKPQSIYVERMTSFNSIGAREQPRSKSTTSNSTPPSTRFLTLHSTCSQAGLGLENLSSAEELINRMLSVDSYNGESTVSLGYAADTNNTSYSGHLSNSSPPRKFSAVDEYDNCGGYACKSEIGGGPMSNSGCMPPRSRSVSVDSLYQLPAQGCPRPLRKSSTGYKPMQLTAMSPLSASNSDGDTSETEQGIAEPLPNSATATAPVLPRANCNYDLRIMRRRSSSAVLRGTESNSTLNSWPIGPRANRRNRRLRSQLLRSYQCPMPECEKRYEAWRSLQAHLTVTHDLKVTKANYELLKNSEFMATMSQPNSPE